MGNNNKKPLIKSNDRRKIQFNKETISMLARVVNECIVNQNDMSQTLNMTMGSWSCIDTITSMIPNKDKLALKEAMIEEVKYMSSCIEVFDQKHQGVLYTDHTNDNIQYSDIDKIINNNIDTDNNMNDNGIKIKDRDKSKDNKSKDKSIDNKNNKDKGIKKNIRTIRLGIKDNLNGTIYKNNPKGSVSPKNISLNKDKKKKKKVKQIVLNIDFKKYKVLNTSFSPNKTLNYNNTSNYSGASASLNINNKSVNSQPAGILNYDRINLVNNSNTHIRNENNNSLIDENQFSSENSYLQKVKNKLKAKQQRSTTPIPTSKFRSQTPDVIREKKGENNNSLNYTNILFDGKDKDKDNYKEKFKEKYMSQERSTSKDNAKNKQIKTKYNEFIAKMAQKGKKDIKNKEKNKTIDSIIPKQKEDCVVHNEIILDDEAKINKKQQDRSSSPIKNETKPKEQVQEKSYSKVVTQIKGHLSKAIKKPIPKGEKLNRSLDSIEPKSDIFGIIKDVKYKSKPDSDEDLDSNSKENNMNSSNSNRSNSNNESSEYDASLPIIRESLESTTSKKSGGFNSSQGAERFSFRPKY